VGKPNAEVVELTLARAFRHRRCKHGAKATPRRGPDVPGDHWMSRRRKTKLNYVLNFPARASAASTPLCKIWSDMFLSATARASCSAPIIMENIPIAAFCRAR
jgi:hypothetical protein